MEISKETIKAFSEIDKAIDESFLKLSDKLSDLTLSHNRKKKALKRIYDFIDDLDIEVNVRFPGKALVSINSLLEIQRFCQDALFCDGREHMKPLVKQQKKGGK